MIKTDIHIDYVVKRRFQNYKEDPNERTLRLFLERLNEQYSNHYDRQEIKETLGFKYISEMQDELND